MEVLIKFFSKESITIVCLLKPNLYYFMKKIFFVACSLLFVGLLSSCKEELESIQAQNQSQTDATSAAKVSAVIKQDYPTAANIVVSTIDSSKVYGCDFTVNGVSHEATVSSNGKILSTYSVTDDSTKVTLPDAIKTYLNTNYAGYKFEKIAVGKDANGAVSYKVLIEYKDQKVTLLFDATGTLVATFTEPKGQKSGKTPKTYSATLTDLPANIQSQLSGYDFVGAVIKTNSDATKTYFVAAKKGEVLYELTFDNNGVLTKTNEVKLKLPKLSDKYLSESDLPQVIKDYISSNYADWKFEKGVVVTKDSVVSNYIVAISKSGKYTTLTFDGSGKIISVNAPKSPDFPKFEDKAITSSELPQVITDYLNKVYTGWSLTKGSVNLKDNVIQSYLLYVTVGTNKYYVYFDKDGEFVAAKRDK